MPTFGEPLGAWGCWDARVPLLHALRTRCAGGRVPVDCWGCRHIPVQVLLVGAASACPALPSAPASELQEAVMDLLLQPRLIFARLSCMSVGRKRTQKQGKHS